MDLSLAKLDRAHVAKLARHYARLDSGSARMRFCAPTTPEAASRHADRIDWSSACVVGGFDAAGEIRAVCELLSGSASADSAELALSVEPQWRGQGVGTAVCRRALAEAAKLKVARAVASCLPENTAMQKIAAKLEGRVLCRDRDGVETEIRIAGPDDSAMAA